MCWIYLITAVRMSWFSDRVKFWLPYKSICTMSEFSMEGKFLILDNTGFIVENNSSLNSLNKRHVSRKCSVDSIPVPQRHTSEGVSLKLWLYLWDLRLLKPTRSWYKYLRLSGSWILKMLLHSGIIVLTSSLLKPDNVSILRI